MTSAKPRGFAEVIMSNNPAIEHGERVFGYFPPANFLIVNPVKVSSASFSDGKEHRKDLPPVYNNYVRLNAETGYDQSMDDIRALLFPLHIMIWRGKSNALISSMD